MGDTNKDGRKARQVSDTRKSELLGEALRQTFDEKLNEPVPDRLNRLMEDLRRQERENCQKDQGEPS